MQRDFVKTFPDRSNHLVFPGEMLSLQVLFQGNRTESSRTMRRQGNKMAEAPG
jgi:hypothetical protein